MTRDLPPWYRPPEPSSPAGETRSGTRTPTGLRGSPVYYHDAPPPSDADSAATTVIEAKREVRGGDRPSHEKPPAPAPAPATAQAGQPSRALPRVGARRGIGGLLLLVLAAGAVLLLGRMLFGWLNSSHTLTSPQRIGALVRVNASTLGQERALVDEGWSAVHGGAYGGAGLTQLVVLAGHPPAGVSDTGQFAHALAEQLVPEGLVFNPKTATGDETGGANFVCGPAAAANGLLAVCAWSDGDVVGVVVDYSGEPLSQTHARAAAGRAAFER
jgi:hypothetical protein